MTDTEIRNLLKDRLLRVEERIGAACQRAGRARDRVTLIAVTKSVDIPIARLLPELGVFDLGESRPQELWRKAEAMQALPIRWHMIGHLQRNKIDRLLPWVHRVHSGDSLRVLIALDEAAKKEQRKLPVLLEINASREANKGGFAPESLHTLTDSLTQLSHLQIDGLMTMAAHTADSEQIRATFAETVRLRDAIPILKMAEFSMGMSNDYEIAIEAGATFIRLGSTLFEGLGE